MEMKDEFLSLISHEFRTPLNVINTAIQALHFIYGEELSDKVKEYIGTIRQNTFRQLRLVNNLLDITRMNSGYFKINKRNIDIIPLTKFITESIITYAEQKGLSLVFSTSLKKQIIGIDSDMYERIILNLLSNAIKFTPKGKTIDVRLSRKVEKGKYSVDIEIIDKGVGIPPDKLGLVFERFGQVDNSLTRQAEGTGIGLYLTKMLVEMMGGQITVESQVGVGSTFAVRFPIRKIKHAPKELIDHDIIHKKLVQAISVEFSDVN
jgi:signal transduction histidine kinase